MGVLDRFERGVERAVNNSFKVFRGELKPVELASALRKEADDRAAAVDRERTVVPNTYVLHLAPNDFDMVEGWGAAALSEELAEVITQHSASQRYSLVGPVEVAFDVDESLSAGHFTVTSATIRGAHAPAGHTAAAAARHPLIDIDGQRYLLTGPVTIIGRGSEADIVVDDPGISRQHLEIRVTPQGVIATDLDSTNGLFVEGHQVPAATLIDGNTLTIGRTRILFWDAEPLSDETGG